MFSTVECVEVDGGHRYETAWGHLTLPGRRVSDPEAASLAYIAWRGWVLESDALAGLRRAAARYPSLFRVVNGFLEFHGGSAYRDPLTT